MKFTDRFRFARLAVLGLPLALCQPLTAQEEEENRGTAAEEAAAEDATSEETPRDRQDADGEDDSEPTQDADELPGGDPDQPEESPREPVEPPTTPGDDRQGEGPPPATASDGDEAEKTERAAPEPAERGRERGQRPEGPTGRGGRPEQRQTPERRVPRGERVPARPGERVPARPGDAEPAVPERETVDESTTDTVDERRADENPPAARDNAAVSPEAPVPEPVREAENDVRQATQEIERTLRQREIRGEEDAQAVIEQILGAESRISRAEIAREERFRREMRAAREEVATAEQRREAARYFTQRLRGQAIEAAPPELLLLPERRRPGRQVVEQRVEQRIDVHQPRYLVDGRRYVHFDNRASVPAILLAAGAMNRVRLQPAREVAPVLYERREIQEALPPAEYRDDSAWVVSYPVDEKSMITSDDILFQQGSTQFADPYSYEIVSALADAMKELPENERFVIEGHASAEGGYESNLVLSQQRAERIVREMVRRGVPPNRLLPVGYGESEARHPENAREELRSQDRRVVVFRLNEQPTASR